MFYLKKAIFASKMDFIDEFYKNSVIYLVPGTCVFDSHKDVASGKIPVFGNILGFPGINWAQKWTKTLRPVSPETLNFERLFKFYFCLVRDYLRSKFHQTCAIFRGERAQNPPPPSPPPPNPKRRVVSWMLHRHENI